MLKDVKSKLVLLCNARLNVNVAYHSKDKEVERYKLTIWQIDKTIFPSVGFMPL